MNKVIIIGNLSSDITTRTVPTASGDVNVASFSVAVNEGYGERRKTTFFRVSAWRGLGENCAKYLAKGRKVMVEGPVSMGRIYTTSNGEQACSLEIQATNVEFLSPASGNAEAEPVTGKAPSAPTAQAPAGFAAVESDELPF